MENKKLETLKQLILNYNNNYTFTSQKRNDYVKIVGSSTDSVYLNSESKFIGSIFMKWLISNDYNFYIATIGLVVSLK